MEDIKKIHPVWLLVLIAVVFAASYVGTYYVSAQSSVYYCKSQTVGSVRYFQCSIDSTFSVSTTGGAPDQCEIIPGNNCRNITIPNEIDMFLGDEYCESKGWAYYPSAYTPSSKFQCLAAPTFPGSSPGSSGEFDFSLSNEGSKTANQGQSITNTITVTKIPSVPTGLVSFNVSELPPESTASTSPASCTPSGSGTMTCAITINILTGTSTPPGTYPVIVTGTSDTPSPTPSFPDQQTSALGYCNGGFVSFYGVINIKNQSPNYEAIFTRTNFTPIGIETAPTTFSVPANTTLAKGGFGNLTYTDPGCNIVVPGNAPSGNSYGQGNSATYSVSVDNVVVEPAVTYSWDYAI